MCHPSEYGCAHPFHHAPWEVGHHPWGCCAPGWTSGRIPTREETLGWLEKYLNHLQAEAKRAEERIAELKKD
jgi:hypothetical protein